MRISDYPKKTDVTGGGQYFAVDSVADGTKAIEMNDIKKSAMDLVTNEEYYDFLDRIGIPWQQRRNIFRGKNLGSVYTDEQKARVSDGTFKGFFIGDYWEKSDIIWRIADINYWRRVGNPKYFIDHLIIVPDSGIGSTQKMNDTDTSAGGYANSKFREIYLSNAWAVIQTMFDAGNIVEHYNVFSNAVSNGIPSGIKWVKSNMDLMNEPMVYGSYIYTPGTWTGNAPSRYTIDKTQLSLFALAPFYISIATNYWLRDVISSKDFAAIDGYGAASYYPASSNLYIRPAFGITG